MTTQPEALRLAAELSKSHLNHHVNHAAAAELRRLHGANERLYKLAEDQDLVIRQQRAKRQELEAQRDALLEALRALVSNEGLYPYSYLDKGIGTATAAGQRWLNARAAIKAVEGEKT